MCYSVCLHHATYSLSGLAWCRACLALASSMPVAACAGWGNRRRPRKVGDERGLQAFVRRLPDEADRASPKRDVIARLDAVEILEKEAAACVHPLGIVLRLQQRVGAHLGHARPRLGATRAVPLPKRLLGHPVVPEGEVVLARGPRVTERCRGFALEHCVHLVREMHKRLTERRLPARVAFCAVTAFAPACHAVPAAPGAGHPQRDLMGRRVVAHVAPELGDLAADAWRSLLHEMTQEAIAPGFMRP